MKHKTSKIEPTELKPIVEAALFVSESIMTVGKLKTTVLSDFSVSKDEILAVIEALTKDYEGRGINLVKVASGWRFQSNENLGPLLGRMWQEPPPRYSKALLETLALIAYKQPITRGEIEDIRGVAVSSSIIKTLIERAWIQVAGYKEIAGKPALYATTNEFLDYFSLTSLSELPSSGLFDQTGNDK